MDQTEASLQILGDSQKESFPYTFEACGLKLRVSESVFSPKYFNGWKIFNDNFPDVAGLDVLEVGVGPGSTALCLAKRGARRVLALDINPAAVEDTLYNARQNNLTNVEARESDIFSTLGSEEPFDIIYWNTPFMWMPADYEYKTMAERGLFDPGYEITDRFLREARSYLKNGACVLFGTGNFGDVPKFKEIAQDYAYSIELLAKVVTTEGNQVDFQLYKLVPEER